MKRSYLPIISSSIITASLAILPLTIPAKAQTFNDGTSNTTYTQNVEYYRDDGDFNWGWLGLLGLAGLAGLAGLNRRREEVTYSEANNFNKPVATEKTVVYTEPNEVNSHITTEDAVRYKDPSRVDDSVNTESVRYRDPNEIRLPDMDGKSDRY